MGVLNIVFIINLLSVALFMYKMEIRDKEYAIKHELDEVDRAIIYLIVSIIGTIAFIYSIVNANQPKIDKDTTYKHFKMLTGIIRNKFGI